MKEELAIAIRAPGSAPSSAASVSEPRGRQGPVMSKTQPAASYAPSSRSATTLPMQADPARKAAAGPAATAASAAQRADDDARREMHLKEQATREKLLFYRKQLLEEEQRRAGHVPGSAGAPQPLQKSLSYGAQFTAQPTNLSMDSAMMRGPPSRQPAPERATASRAPAPKALSPTAVSQYSRAAPSSRHVPKPGDAVQRSLSFSAASPDSDDDDYAMPARAPSRAPAHRTPDPEDAYMSSLQQQRDRILRIRVTIRAAETIQRAWRHYRFRRNLRLRKKKR
jgi:hypothetical protein